MQLRKFDTTKFHIQYIIIDYNQKHAFTEFRWTIFPNIIETINVNIDIFLHQSLYLRACFIRQLFSDKIILAFIWNQ